VSKEFSLVKSLFTNLVASLVATDFISIPDHGHNIRRVDVPIQINVEGSGKTEAFFLTCSVCPL